MIVIAILTPVKIHPNGPTGAGIIAFNNAFISLTPFVFSF